MFFKQKWIISDELGKGCVFIILFSNSIRLFCLMEKLEVAQTKNIDI